MYVRSKLAEAWHVPPWEVDDAPHDEIATQLRLWAIEAECAPAPSSAPSLPAPRGR